MKVNSVNSVNFNQINSQQKQAQKFGSVIPVSLMIDGKRIEQSIDNKKIIDSITRRFNIMLNKGKGIFKDIAEEFKKHDKDFDGKTRSIRGAYQRVWTRRRYLVTGEDIENVNKISADCRIQEAKKIYRQNEETLVHDKSKRLPNIKDFTIEVKSRVVNKKNGIQETKFDITGGSFTFIKQPKNKNYN